MNVDSIVAVATPPGRGGVGILRLSGPLSYAIALRLSQKKYIAPRKVNFSSFVSLDGELIDKGLVLYFQTPNSFTGEDVVEFQVHGSPMVLDCLLNECVSLGARIAKPGEFSERAFLNDKIDLTQAEAIADLIDASSQMAARMAVRSLQGDFSQKIDQLNQQLIQLRLYVEAAIDFPDEDIDFLNDGKIATMLSAVVDALSDVQKSAVQGALVREGLSIVIAGLPNAGKSTLINALCGREIAIVTEIAGTTRDVMREHVLIDEIPVHLIDTAGLRESLDVVEQEGIKRAWQELHQADCVLHLMDIQQTAIESKALEDKIRKALPVNVPVIRVFNKIDATNMVAKSLDNAVYLSAKTGEGLSILKDKIKQAVGYQPAEGQFLARRRHLNAIDEAKSFLLAGQEQLLSHRAGELLADDLREAQQSLGRITGEFTADDLLGQIFSNFCIGK